MPSQVNGPEIRRRRKIIGLSVRSFGALVKIGFAEISNIEKCKKGASHETILKIAKGLKCSPAEISLNGELVATIIPTEDHESLRRFAPPGDPDWESEVLQKVIHEWIEIQKKKG